MQNKVYDWKPVFLAALEEYPVIRHACEAVGVHRRTAQNAKRDDKDFSEAWDAAMEAGIDRAEKEAMRRAVVGFEEPVIDRGRLVYRTKRVVREDGTDDFELVYDEAGQPVPLTVRKHSDALLSLVLKGRRKQVYADRTELTGADGGAVAVDQTERATRVAHLLELAAKRKDYGDLA